MQLRAERRLADDSFMSASHAAGPKPGRPKPFSGSAAAAGLGCLWRLVWSGVKSHGWTLAPAQIGESPPSLRKKSLRYNWIAEEAG